MTDPRDQRLRAAWLAHGYGLTQAQIAERLGLSRTTVNRLLDEARRRGEVRVWIDTPEGDFSRLALAVEARLGIPEVVVVPADPAGTPVRAVGLALGRLLSERIAAGMRLGVGWGRTLGQALDAFQPPERAGVTVISLLGGQVRPGLPNPGALAARIAAAIGAEVMFLPAPLLVDAPETRTRLIERCGLQSLFDMAAGLDLAVFGAGPLTGPDPALAVALLSAEERAALARSGAVGEVLGQFIDAEGRDVPCAANDRVMAVGLDAVAGAGARILAAGGANRAEMIRAAHRRLSLTTLVTDESAARALA